MEGVINLDYNTVKIRISTLPGEGGLLITTSINGDDDEIQNTIELNAEGIVVKSEESSILINSEEVTIETSENYISVTETGTTMTVGDNSISLTEAETTIANGENSITLNGSGIEIEGTVTINGNEY